MAFIISVLTMIVSIANNEYLKVSHKNHEKHVKMFNLI